MEEREKKRKNMQLLMPPPLFNYTSTNNFMADKDHVTSSSSTSSLPYLPEDVILRILQKLPSISQVRFKCVSKRWYDLISNPTSQNDPILYGFIYQNHSGSLGFLPIVKPSSDAYVEDMKLELGNLNPRNQVEASSNGFLLLSCPLENKKIYVIYNPFTKQTHVVPMPDSCGRYGVLESLAFCCKSVNGSSNQADYSMLNFYDDTAFWMDWWFRVREFNVVNNCLNWRDLNLKKRCSLNYCRGRCVGRAVGNIDKVFYFIIGIRPSTLSAIDLNPHKLEVIQSTLPFNNTSNDDPIMCVFEDCLFYCDLMPNGNGNGIVEYRDSIIELHVSKKNPRAAEKDFDWQREYSVGVKELGCYVNELTGFHPRNPRMIFFIDSEGDFKSYDFQLMEVVCHAHNVVDPGDYLGELFPCERFPWPVSLRT